MATYDNPANVLLSGRKEVAVAGTREALSTSTDAISRVVVTAETDNTQPVTVGGSTVVGALLTRVGTPLAAGASVTFNVNQLSDVYVDALVNTEGVTYTAERA